MDSKVRVIGSFSRAFVPGYLVKSDSYASGRIPGFRQPRATCDITPLIKGIRPGPYALYQSSRALARFMVHKEPRYWRDNNQHLCSGGYRADALWLLFQMIRQAAGGGMNAVTGGIRPYAPCHLWSRGHSHGLTAACVAIMFHRFQVVTFKAHVALEHLQRCGVKQLCATTIT
eukprot:COSAG03_NODE_946_length_5235_cov_80.053933_5_plen_173_part_00